MSKSSVVVTGKGTAGLRAIESDSGNRALFSDPFARSMALPAGMVWAEALPEPMRTMMIDLIAVRTRFIDDFCAHFLDKHAPVSGASTVQVVLLGAGYDTRVLRIARLRSATVFELDLAELHAEKSRAMNSSGIHVPPNLVRVATDLTDHSWADGLLQAGFSKDKPTLWIAEGLSSYLPEQANVMIYRLARDLSAADGHLVATFVGASGEPYGPGNDPGKRHVFFTDRPADMLRACGWTAEQHKIAVISASLGRERYLADFDYWLATAGPT